jgi:hypothetical protein
MKHLLIRLYPRSWRERYGAEFEALLEERPLGPFDAADVLLAALDAHLHLRGATGAAKSGRSLLMSMRIGGFAAVLGGALWLAGFLIAQFNGSDDDSLAQFLALAGTLGLLVALAGLSAVQSRLHPRLVWTAFALPAIGALASALGLLEMVFTGGSRLPTEDVDPWILWALGTVVLVAGSGLFALVSWRSRVLSRPGLTLLAGAMVGLAPVVLISSGLAAVPWEPLVSIAFLALLLSFAIGWIVIGVDAVRGDRRQVASAAEASP